MKKLLFSATIAGCLTISSVAEARSTYDGSWDLVFVTRRGACDPTYNFSVNITDGIVTHPNLVRFRGYVERSGGVRASVTVQDKFASGSGKLAGNSSRGTWSGYSGTGALLGVLDRSAELAFPVETGSRHEPAHGGVCRWRLTNREQAPSRQRRP